ncbi:ABC transporter ATP-binding protein [Micromonospora sonneratiae]|uniref:ABC transporter ATP-binding protein n=1 Tax=Micromonospora sonneratiae TaxID=1184706 RepID=A0ABW3Y807_9ACTN
MTLLEVKDLRAGYGRSEVLHGISFTVGAGEIAVMLGANGAGKTTTLRALSGLIDRRGDVAINGEKLPAGDAARAVSERLAHVPEGRGTFPGFTVHENLMLGAYTRRDRAAVAQDVAYWQEFFPILGQRAKQRAGTLSGGEQQMLAIARAMMLRPQLLILDEPSQGLAPVIVRDLFSRLSEINKSMGIAMLIVEQNAHLSLSIAARGYVLEAGKISVSQPAAELQANDEIRRAYLGG